MQKPTNELYTYYTSPQFKSGDYNIDTTKRRKGIRRLNSVGLGLRVNKNDFSQVGKKEEAEIISVDQVIKLEKDETTLSDEMAEIM